MNGNYMTVAEFAAKSGVSKQSIYNQIQEGRRLHPYVRRVNGQKMIRADALSFYVPRTAAPEDEDPQQGQPEQSDPLVSLLMDQIKAKDEQIRAKDEQLAARDAQITELTDTIKRQAVLQYRLQEQIALLTGTETATDGAEAADQVEHTQEQPEAAQRQPEATQTAEAQPVNQSTGGLFGWFWRIRRGK